MKTGLLIFGSLMCLIGYCQLPSNSATNKTLLPNGWTLSPAGRSLPLGDLPLNMTVSSSGKYIAVTNNGQGIQSIQLIDARHEKILDNIVVAKSWLGLKFTSDEKYLYASGGNDNLILKYEINNNKLLLKDSILLGKKWPHRISPAGMDIDNSRHLAYVTTKDNNSLYILELLTKKIRQIVKLPAEAYTCLLSAANTELYISCWGCGKIITYNTVQEKITGEINVGSHPNDMCLSKNGEYLFVANSDDNSVSVINIKRGALVETLNAAMYADAPNGSTTNGVALSNDQRTLYIANADNNCLAVFDVSKPGNSFSRGFIPVGWYPTSVKVIGNKIFVTNGKGYSSFPNPNGPYPLDGKSGAGFHKGDLGSKGKVQYIAGLFMGTMSIIDVPAESRLKKYSRTVYNNTPFNKAKELLAEGEEGNPIPKKVGDPSPVKYVFYIIKENRTYDQVLGDIPEGNGDASLCLFGEKVTPNLHALAKEFVLLDNFYCDGEVSADGHNWSMGAYANDYLEKNWVTSYGHRGGTYDAEGTRNIANNKMGFIWDHCKRAGVSFRTYGEFADDYKPNLPVLKNHFCPYYTSWDQKVRDTTRVHQWERDFDSLLSINALPRLNTLRIINDHTEGLSKGRPTPFAHVADNDLAIGMFIEYLRKSPVWNESAVFILEDDAQNGPDHVDAHRTTAYVAGGYVKRHYVDHTMYSTSSMLRTIELILGIPPMSQYDAGSTPMWNSFKKEPSSSSFSCKPLQVDMNERNTAVNKWQQMSDAFDFSKEDKVPDRVFNEVIWKAVKGTDAVLPPPVRGAFFRTIKRKEIL